MFNLSGQPVTASLELPEYAGRTVRDLFGGSEFPRISPEGRVTLTLGGHGYYWLKIRPLRADGEPATETTAMPVITAEG